MDLAIVPIQYEYDPLDWITQKRPQIRIRALAALGRGIYIALLSSSDAAELVAYLTENMVPPFVRRYMVDDGQYAPGFVFDFEHRLRDRFTLKALQQTLQVLARQDITSDDRMSIQEKIHDISVQMERLEQTTTNTGTRKERKMHL